MNRSNDYRRKADDCRSRAAAASLPSEQRELLLLAQYWTRLAQLAEDRAGFADRPGGAAR
ncbi:MAG TPA: hypothetical protein VNR11_22115 [Xanthobacteraceae bacterium]|nr:hypothetical protein [Xanthobacteraceae bacterium]